MKASFAKAQSPLLAAVIKQETTASAIAAIKNAEVHGATAIDLHLSCLDDDSRSDESLKRIFECTSLPILGLNYKLLYNGTFYECTDDERAEFFLRTARLGIAAVDIQGYTFRDYADGDLIDSSFSFAAAKPLEVITNNAVVKKQTDFIEQVHSLGCEVLLSTHPNTFLDCNQILELVNELVKRKPDVIKLVTTCDNDDQLAESFKTILALKNNFDIPVHLHCKGKHGKITRLVNPILGGHLIFCCDGYEHNSDVEQLDLQTAARMVDDFRKILK